VEGHKLHLGGSVGIALYPEHGSDGSSLLHHADLAMYLAKRGNLGYHLYSPDMEERAALQLMPAAELRRALEGRQFVLHYQPELDLRTDTVPSVEALIRWEHPERGLLEPGEFLATAEATGLIQPITRWVIQQAIEQCKTWRDAGLQLRVAVNLSARSLQDEHLTHVIERQMALSQLDPSFLRIEISEATLSRTPSSELALLTRLHDLGVQISIDNFGSSYASLARLRELRASEIKIDRCFTRNVLRDPEDALVVRSVIEAAHTLDLEVVAQGAEDQQVVNVLMGMGCDLVQGFHFGPPLPAAELASWVMDREAGNQSSYEASA
jgi:EAL domain-containing protein (putative c-di-GMP-specific phosphodiesterase class I)